MDDCIDKNIVDKDECPQIAEIESRCVHMLSDLWNSLPETMPWVVPPLARSEAAMLGGMAAETALGGAAQGAGQGYRQAQPGDRTGTGVLAQVHPLLGRRTPRNTHGSRAAADDAGRSARAL